MRNCHGLKLEAPELASVRARNRYHAKTYPQASIRKRLCSIAVRGEMTDEWKERGVQEGKKIFHAHRRNRPRPRRNEV